MEGEKKVRVIFMYIVSSLQLLPPKVIAVQKRPNRTKVVPIVKAWILMCLRSKRGTLCSQVIQKSPFQSEDPLGGIGRELSSSSIKKA